MIDSTAPSFFLNENIPETFSTQEKIEIYSEWLDSPSHEPTKRIINLLQTEKLSVNFNGCFTNVFSYNDIQYIENCFSQNIEEIPSLESVQEKIKKLKISERKRHLYKINKVRVSLRIKDYYESNKTERLSYMKKYYKDHVDYRKSYDKNYNSTHRPERNAYMRAYRAKKKAEQKCLTIF